MKHEDTVDLLQVHKNDRLVMLPCYNQSQSYPGGLKHNLNLLFLTQVSDADQVLMGSSLR